MKKNSIYIISMEIKEIKPKIWRKIAIHKDETFWDLHIAIQSVMDWYDYHLHTFGLKDMKTGSKFDVGIPIEEDDDILPDWEYYLEDYLNKDNREILYRYDFGDNWQVPLKLEDITDAEPGKKYPLCLDGARSAPPEDVGGIGGYYRLIEIMKDKEDSDYEDMVRWYGGIFDPEHFDISDIEFMDPEKRFDEVFNNDEIGF